jgi:oligopeptide transport system permease protein
MIRYIIVRTIWVFVVLVAVLSINFSLLKLAPEYPPTEEEAREIYYARQVSDGYMTLRVETDPDVLRSYISREVAPCDHPRCYVVRGETRWLIYTPVPISIQYVNWVRNVVTDWNWGVSTRLAVNTPAFQVLTDRIPVTLRLNLISLVFYIPIGFALGILAALKKNSRVDDAISLGVMVFISVPSFVTMTVLVMVFGYWLRWLPAQFPARDAIGIVQYTGMILPVLGLSFGAIAGLTRTTRAELAEVLTSEFVLLARAKGLTYRQSVLRHAMRNSMVPLVPDIIGSFVGLLSGSVIIELIYSIPGTGRIFLRALEASSYDYNVILVTTAFYTTIGLFAILLVDLSYGLVDPRIRMGARK